MRAHLRLEIETMFFRPFQLASIARAIPKKTAARRVCIGLYDTQVAQLSIYSYFKRLFFFRKMAKEVFVEGYDEYLRTVQSYKGKKVFVLFCGSKDETGKSWCPDCVRADPVITKSLKQAPADSVLIHVGVGEKAFWKDQQNVFRKDPNLQLRKVPTLFRVGKGQKLEEEQCVDQNLVQMFFEED